MLRGSVRRTATRAASGTVRLAFNVGAGDNLVLRATVFDTPTGHAFLKSCPHVIDRLQSYGAEVYGPTSTSLPSNPARWQPKIPPGGLAYSEQGSYLCVFYGQLPAWPVDYIGQIDNWEGLKKGTWRDLSVTRE